MPGKRRGHGEGTIYAYRGGYAAQVTLGRDAMGKQQRKTVYAKTKKECLEKLYKLQQKVASGEVSSEVKVQKMKVALDYWYSIAKIKVEPTTADRYRAHVDKWLAPILGHIPVPKVTPCHVTQLYDAMEEKGASAAERKKVGTCLRQFFKVAHQMGFCLKNPALDVPLPKTQKEEIHPLTAEGVAAFLKAALGLRLFALYPLAFDSGMRQGEMFALAWPDVDLELGAVMVTKSLQERKGQLKLKDVKTVKGKRRIRLSPPTVSALREHHVRMEKEGRLGCPVFCDTTGKWLRKSNFCRNWFYPVVERAGVRDDLRFHDIRHTCATLLLLHGGNIKAVSERLGHSSIDITLETYSHVLPDMQDQLVGAMGNLIGVI